MRIGILGAGITGTCAALELASRGFAIDLYDQREEPVSAASFCNEGKIHLGILYAKDLSRQTARLMITGALAFTPLLRKWVGFRPDQSTISTPFFYGVHRGTMVPVDELRAHYQVCKDIFREAIEAGAEPYLDMEQSCETAELMPSEIAALVEPEFFETMFRTSERAVDPRGIAELLRQAIRAEPRINFIGSATITDVTVLDCSLSVTFEREGTSNRCSYDHVANALWDGRLEIDARLGLRPLYPWSYRYKFGSRIFIPLTPTDVPSITCVLGPFGDIVNFGAKGLFLSWYPKGMIGTSYNLRPPEWDAQLSVDQRIEVFRRSFAEWEKRCPMLSTLAFSDKNVDPAGGVIFAWGDTGVDDQQSKLHDRHELGVYSLGNYHSVNTGKYTLGPLMGLRTAERILSVS